jgi:hypothetical protein
MGRLVWILAVGAAVPLGGCELIDKIPPPTSAHRPVHSTADDAWKRSANWLYATEGATGGQAGECQRMAELLEGEKDCAGALCKTGGEAAAEWLDKCSKLEASKVEAIRALETTWKQRASAAPSPCSTEYDDLMESGCKPETCRQKAQGWATRCGDTEAGLLTGTILLTRVARRVGGEGGAIDLRGCASLEKALLEGAKCASEDECRERMPDVESYAARCQGEGKPASMTVAVAQMAIAAGANRETAPIAIAADVEPLVPDAVPLVLADGSGAILSLCHQRPVDLKGFAELHERCVGTPLTIARLFYDKSGKPTVQVGQLPAPERFEPPSPYPWLEIAGQRPQYAAEKAKGLAAALDAVGNATGADALGKLVTAIDQYSLWIDLSPEVQKVLREADAKLVPAFTAAAQTKVKGARKVFDPVERAGLQERTKTRPLADLKTDGTFHFAAANDAYWLEPATLLPTAMAAYRSGIAPLEERAKFGAPLLPAKVAAARKEGLSFAKICAAAQTKEQSIEHRLNGCVFTGCADDEVAKLVADWEASRQQAKLARIAADVVLCPTGSGAERETLAADQGCEKPGP